MEGSVIKRKRGKAGNREIKNRWRNKVEEGRKEGREEKGKSVIRTRDESGGGEAVDYVKNKITKVSLKRGDVGGRR